MLKKESNGFVLKTLPATVLSSPDQLQVPPCWVKGRFYGGFNFPFMKLIEIGYWFHAYLIGDYCIENSHLSF